MLHLNQGNISYITIKHYSPLMESSFKKWIQSNKIDFYFVEWASKLISSSHSHSLKYTSDDIIECLLKSLKINNSKDIREVIHTWVMYSLSEYMIYKEYTIFIITASCCIIATNSNLKIINYLKKITRQEEYNIIIKCVSDITSLFNNTSNEGISNRKDN